MIFLFWEGWEPVKFPVGKKRIPAFSQEECWKLPLCRARLISVNEPDSESPAHPQPNFLEAPRLTVRTKLGSHLPPSRSLMGGLFLSPFECSGHYERPHRFHVLIEPLMNGIGTAHNHIASLPGHRTPVHNGTRAARFISLNKKPLYFLLPPRARSIPNDLTLSLEKACASVSAAYVSLQQYTDVGSTFPTRSGRFSHS